MKSKLFSLLFASSLASALPVSSSCKISRFGDLNGVTTLQTLEGENMNRSCALIVNKGANYIYIQVSTSLQSGADGVLIPGGGNWEPEVTPVNALYMRPLSGTTANVYYHFGHQ